MTDWTEQTPPQNNWNPLPEDVQLNIPMAFNQAGYSFNTPGIHFNDSVQSPDYIWFESSSTQTGWQEN